MSFTMNGQTHLTDMGRQCDYCQGRSFRRSRLKGRDWIGLILLRFPVRCLSCSQRQAVSLSVARRAVPSSVKQVRLSRGSMNPERAAAVTSEAAKPLGGGTFPALRAQQPVTMPDLRDVALEHHTPVQREQDEHFAS